jgi:4-hydroxy-tetrahydrodipicolinate synthase
MIRGSIPALVTPMLADERVDYSALTALLEWHIAEGTDAVVSVGTTGESATLSTEEHLAVIAHTVNVVRKRIPVIAGTGANATSEAIYLTEQATALGVDACLSVTPYYNKPTQHGLVAHFEAISRAVPRAQIILYNVPGRTGVDMLPATVETLSARPNIIGLKEARGTLERIRELRALALPMNFSIYTGDDATARESILLGCAGDISVTANVAPKLMHQMCAAALRGESALAAELDAQLALLHRDLFLEPNPIPVKWALSRLGRINGALRLPLTPLSSQYEDDILSALAQAGAF